MTSIVLSMDTLAVVKRTLLKAFAGEKSSHLSEALATALGFNSHAALLAFMKGQDSSFLKFHVIDDNRFIHRLHQLNGRKIPSDEDYDWFETIGIPVSPDIRSTRCSHYSDYEYKTDRQRAWRNCMIVIINEGIRQRHFSLHPDDNRWARANEKHGETRLTYRLSFEGIPVLARVDAISFGELAFDAILWPSSKGEEWLGAWLPEFIGGDAFVSGLLERTDGAWLQFDQKPRLKCRRSRLQTLAQLTVEPIGYGDRGQLK